LTLKNRLQKVNYLILITPLTKKIKTWLDKNDEEVYTMKFVGNTSRKEITDINNDPFEFKFSGVYYREDHKTK
jgi:hypothetical protein